jgi:phenylalanyl-tRNA synthetase beta chain
MIVSWNWLKDYVKLDLSVDALTQRLMMAGFNLEGVEEVEGDFAIDLEITSNRPDCLGHLGIAREIAALLKTELKMPDGKPAEKGPSLEGRVKVEIAADASDWCPQYRARLIEGVKIGPSPDWMQRRLRTLGLRPINNVVDVTNYVMFECGQPLHAFDFTKVAGGTIVVRNAKPGEKLTAINHKEYALEPWYGMIADPSGVLAFAGVMGGASSEIHSDTTSVLLESAEFAPLTIRRMSRALDLSSDASYRFERKIDPGGVAWASDRAATLIAETSGGIVAAGAVHAGRPIAEPQPVRLRYRRVGDVLGVTIAADEAKATLTKLGLQQVAEDAESVTVRPPAFRRDLTREIDLVEEVGRIHGYGDVPEDEPPPLRAVGEQKELRALDLVRASLVGMGWFETVTFTFSSVPAVESVRPWTSEAPLTVRHSSRRHENALRESLLPSLAQAAALNEARGTRSVRFFEIAHAFIPKAGPLPDERTFLALAALEPGDDKDASLWRTMRGQIEAALRRLKVSVEFAPADAIGLATGKSAEILLGGKRVGVIGYVGDDVRKTIDLRGSLALAELDVAPILAAADLNRRVVSPPDQPAIERDLSIVFDEQVRWADVEAVVRQEAGGELESLAFADLYRGKQVPAGKKSLMFKMIYRANDRTLTGDEVDDALQRIVAALKDRFSGELRV